MYYMKFFLTVLLIWGSMHLYVWARVQVYARFGVLGAAGLALAMLVLMFGPIGGIALSRAGHVPIGRAVALVGMTWAGGFFLFFWLSLLHDTYNCALTVAGLFVPAARSIRLVGREPILAETALVALICVYSLFEARHIVTERARIETAKLPPGLDRVRIVQISDIHLGLTVGRRHLARIVREVEEAEPDLLVSTGDLVDAEMCGLDDQAKMLAAISAPLGKYAVTGNHEYYAGLEQALDFTRRAGFTVLSNDAATVREGLTVAGVDDDTALRGAFGREEPWDEQEVLGRAAGGGYVVFLKHRPLLQADSVPLMDLQLSGHTHRGQIFPFTLFVAAYYEYPHGLVELTEGRYLYTSRGTGIWGPPMRFLNPPEVTVIDVVRAGEMEPADRP
jgi:predicted MPP superfamily phosphohydrolase